MEQNRAPNRHTHIDGQVYKSKSNLIEKGYSTPQIIGQPYTKRKKINFDPLLTCNTKIKS